MYKVIEIEEIIERAKKVNIEVIDNAITEMEGKKNG